MSSLLAIPQWLCYYPVYETHISAEKEEAVKDARISQAIRHYERSRAPETPAQEGSRTTLGIGSKRMPRKNTLTHADFVRVEKAKFRRERGSFFILSYGTLTGRMSQESGSSCVVSKKTAARAVDRNLIKRRCRDAVRQCLPMVPASSILVFYAMKPAKGASFADIKNDVAGLVARAGAKLRAS